MKGFTFCRHPELTLFPLSVTPEGCNPESSHRISGSSKKGFTLIELLVVVLIIGILASVALPQYQKAVLKSHAAEAWTNLKTLNTAAAAYCLENPGEWSHDLDLSLLAVDVQNSKNFSYSGYIECSASIAPYSMFATWQGDGTKNFTLGINATTGRRSCRGSSCSELGFNKKSSAYDDSICVCAGGLGSCYYTD